MLYADGGCIKDIADRFDCDPKTIRRRAEELDLQHPNSPKQKRRNIDTALDEMNAIGRYESGVSLMGLAAAGRTSVDVVRSYLQRRGVKIRTRVQQVAETMRKYGTRFHSHKNEMRLYAYKRDDYGLVTEVRIYQNNNPKPIVRHL